MNIKLKQVLLLTAAVVLLASPAAFAASIDIKGHSPITLFVTDPYGATFGCTYIGAVLHCSTNGVAWTPCSPTACTSGPFTMNSTAGETATYAFCTTIDSTSGGCPTISVTNANPGIWKVVWYSTLTSTSDTMYVTIEETCAVGGPPCTATTFTLVQPTSITSGSSNSGDPVTFNITPNGLGVPEFAFGAFLVVALLAPALLFVRRVRHG